LKRTHKIRDRSSEKDNNPNLSLFKSLREFQVSIFIKVLLNENRNKSFYVIYLISILKMYVLEEIYSYFPDYKVMVDDSGKIKSFSGGH
jgi:hypothetical protein